MHEDWCEEVAEDGLVSCESVERPSREGRKKSVALSLFEVRWDGKMGKRAEGGWRKHLFEVQAWRQVRGFAGAVLCETRDLSIKWPQWHLDV